MNTEEMNYRIHFTSGKVWYCNQFGYIKDIALPDKIYDLPWVDGEIDFVMVNAIEADYLATDHRPTEFVPCLMGVEAVEILDEPRIPRYYSWVQGHLENFA